MTAELSQHDPPFAAADVREFGRRYWELCDWAKRNRTPQPTPNEVLTYIGRIRSAPPPSPAPTRIYDKPD